MYRPRIIPVLLLSKGGLYKTKKFDSPTYVGDPINAVKIFNELKADELVFLDIEASKDHTEINYEVLSKISEEAYMPFSYGGGLNSIDKIKKAFKAGCEKIVLNSVCYSNPQLIKDAAAIYGNQAVVISIDVKKEENTYVLYANGGNKQESISLDEHVKRCEELGAGEIFINSIDNDGTRDGYDNDLIKRVSQLVSIPVIACGGAHDEDDLASVIKESEASAAAAGSMFVFMGRKNAVMINYPDSDELIELFEE